MELEAGDLFYLTDNKKIGKKDLPVICTLPGVTRQLKEGERVLFDDGLFEAVIKSAKQETVLLEMIRVSAKKPLLKEEKGINFPDSILSEQALTEFDRQTLPFILEHADMVGYSFIHKESDLTMLQEVMKNQKLPVILKIETPQTFRNLPQLLIKAMEQQCFGVMIARGDLAVEMGFEQMGEVQEEICRICEAAHAPVI